MKIENLFVTWQQRSAQSNMPISVSIPAVIRNVLLKNKCFFNLRNAAIIKLDSKIR